MQLISPSVNLIAPTSENYFLMLDTIEKAYRVCYNSQLSATREDCENFIKRMVATGHESPLEHVNITVEIVTDRAVSHELVRHRIASYSQQSQRYCNYSKEKFGSEISFVKPYWLDAADEDTYYAYINFLTTAEKQYLRFVRSGMSAQDARGVLPNATATALVMTMNIRSWRNFFKLRAIGTTGKPHPDMQRLATKILSLLDENFPCFFEDLFSQKVQDVILEFCSQKSDNKETTPQPAKDNVNHPQHYQGKYECIDEMISLFGVEAVKSFCRCNTYKYRFRATQKNGEEDIKKAEWYMTKLKELERNDEK